MSLTYPTPFFPHLVPGSADYKFAAGRWTVSEGTYFTGSRYVDLRAGNTRIMSRQGDTFSSALTDLLANAPFLGEADMDVIRKRIATLKGAGL